MSDQYWAQTKLLMHCEGIHGSVRFVDERHNVFTPAGNASLSTVQKKFGASALYFDGTGDYLTSAASANYNIGTTDFTLEFFIYPRDTTNANPMPVLIGSGIAANAIWLTADDAVSPGKYAFFAGNSSTTAPLLVSTSSIVYDQWAHIAITRSANTWRLFVNGTLEASATYTGAATNASTTCALGGNATAANQFFGYLDEVRLTVGVARYTATFTAPAAAFEHEELVFDADYDKVVFHSHFEGENGGTTFVDRKAHAITTTGAPINYTPDFKFGGSCLQSPAGSKCSVGYTNDLNLGSGDFTIETWVHAITATDNGIYPYLMLRPNGFSGKAVYLYQSSSSVFVGVGLPHVTNDSSVNYGAATNIGSSSWALISLSRLGNLLIFHVNGVVWLTKTIGVDCSMPSATYNLEFGALGGVAIRLDEIRITVGKARYPNGPYTPAAEPFPDFVPQKLTGTVRDSAGTPISRTVRSYRSSDGLYIGSAVSDPTTGAFSLPATDISEHFVVVHDPAKNALVYDHITPVL